MSYETNDKMVSHPDHYKSGGFEVIDIIDEFTKDLSGTEAVCTANAIKYILRWKKKNGIQDVKKAIWYLQHMVDKEEERLREEHAEFDDKRLEKIINLNHPTFIGIQPIKDNTEYTKKVDLNTGKVTVISQTCDNCKFKSKKFIENPCCICHNHSKWEEKKLEPGCDRCEISECKFLEDPFMNPPYNELWDKWQDRNETIKKMQDSIDSLIDDKKKLKECNDDLLSRHENQKEVNRELLRDKKEMQDSIDFLENDKKILKESNAELIKANNDLWDKLYKANKENADLKKIILKRDLKIKELRESDMYGNDPTCGIPVKIEKEDDNTGFVNGLKKANEQLAEDFNKKADNKEN